MQHKWFQSWFNSPYYHILYSGRNNEEAEFLIDNLTAFLNPDQNSKVLDIACGKGRHAIYLHKKGYDVTGIDLSENSINFARQFEEAHLEFFVHDMRKLFYINYFDISLNLFTSFGYFDNERDHLKALKAFRKGLKANGTLVIDYFNTEKIISNLVHTETKITGGIAFNISKSVQEGKIIKEIEFEDKGRKYMFTEKVAAFYYADFSRLLHLAGLKIVQSFGNYALGDFDENNSDRLILICKKI